MRRTVYVAVLALIVFVPSGAATLPSVRTLDGSANNVRHPAWGQANTKYERVAAPNYADGISVPVGGPPTRYVSNRVFNDVHQNLFSENGVSQWGFVWGQFMDHTIGLRQEVGGENAPIAFDANDPTEEFENDFGVIDFHRTPAAAGTGINRPRQQINTVSSYIDGWSVYGGTNTRLEWLRVGPVDGNLGNNAARLLLQEGILPRRDFRGNANTAPEMALMGRLAGTPAAALVAGDVRANENIALSATHTLFAREHNKIVNALPDSLSAEQKFQVARKVVGAEQQFITYNEFLPALAVNISAYRGYDPGVNATLTNEFAVVGYRAHSMIHGEVEPVAAEGTYSNAQLEAFEEQGIEVEHEGGEVKLVTPLNLAFGNPNLFREIGLAPVLNGIGRERQYRNDEMIDNQLRSVLFQVPVSGNPDCLDGPGLPECFDGVVDLGAIDIERGRDHGMPRYNALRLAYGLAPKASFTAITSESTESFPSDPEIDHYPAIDDPDILDFVELRDAGGNIIPLESPEAQTEAVTGVRRTTTAARLKAIYGSPSNLDAFTGMVAERHPSGSELGQLQRAIWKREFEALRDGDRFFYANDPDLVAIQAQFGITYRHTLSQIIRRNTDLTVRGNVFEAAE